MSGDTNTGASTRPSSSSPERSEFRPGEYIVILRGNFTDKGIQEITNFTGHNNVSANFIYMQRSTDIFLKPVLDDKGYRASYCQHTNISMNGRPINLKDSENRPITRYLCNTWRYANKLEVIVYRKLKKPFDVTKIIDIPLSIVPRSKSHPLYGEKLILEDYLMDKNDKVGLFFVGQPSIYDVNEFNIQVLKDE